jgi:hypothetical protein
MSKYEPGTRVGAISHSDEGTVYFYGWGVYEGDEVPPKGTAGPFGIDASLVGPNPKIKLDSGDVVWGCQCWWGSEKVIKAKLDAFEQVKEVPVPTLVEDEDSEDGEVQT